MYRRKVALYVEGQSEQILITRLLSEWWSYSNIRIRNHKQLGVCAVANYSSGEDESLQDFFHIIDVSGDGFLGSSIAMNAKRQHQDGYVLVGLRDLHSEDYDRLYPLHREKTPEIILNNLREGLRLAKCDRYEEVEIFFSIMEIEAWQLAFSDALLKWGKGKKHLIPQDLESIQHPIEWMKTISQAAGYNKNPKALHSVTSFVDHIVRNEIVTVYESNRSPSFTKFWQKILSITA